VGASSSQEVEVVMMQQQHRAVATLKKRQGLSQLPRHQGL
jgi:hypothetical protein